MGYQLIVNFKGLGDYDIWSDDAGSVNAFRSAADALEWLDEQIAAKLAANGGAA